MVQTGKSILIPESLFGMTMGELSSLHVYVKDKYSSVGGYVHMAKVFRDNKLEHRIDQEKEAKAIEDRQYWKMVMLTIEKELDARIEVDFVLQ